MRFFINKKKSWRYLMCFLGNVQSNVSSTSYSAPRDPPSWKKSVGNWISGRPTVVSSWICLRFSQTLEHPLYCFVLGSRYTFRIFCGAFPPGTWFYLWCNVCCIIYWLIVILPMHCKSIKTRRGHFVPSIDHLQRRVGELFIVTINQHHKII